MNNQNYDKKAKFLREHGWRTWYNDDYWVHSSKFFWVYAEPLIDYTKLGKSTDEAIALTLFHKKRPAKSLRRES